ncbi:MAG: peptidylprolyl isomerase [Dehalococcoidia bacterium]
MMRSLALIALIFALVLAACDDDDSDTNLPTDTPPAGAITPGSQTTPPAGTPVDFAQACQKSTEKQWTEAPDLIIDTSKKYVATIKTSKGEILVELYSDTPTTTNNFVFLACTGYYDGLTFHRVVPDFVIQGGDPTGSGSGGPGYTIPDEDDPGHLMAEGVISMAKGDPGTTGSQYFITIGLGSEGDLSYLDSGFTVFGTVTEGMDVAKQIAVSDVMESITIAEQ